VKTHADSLAAAVVVLLAAGPAAAQVAYDFALTDGTLAASQVVGNPGAGGWTYGTTIPSVGGTATWATPGQDGSALALTTTALDVPVNGPVTGSFTHRFNFEPNFDGGVIQFAVNFGVFTTVPGNRITGQSYNGHAGVGAPIISTGECFNPQSPGYGSPAYVTSNFTLGTGSAQTFTSGDRVQFRFLVAFDGNILGSPPNWQIATLSFANVTAVPELGTPVLLGTAAAIAGLRRRRRRPQWRTGSPAGVPIGGGDSAGERASQ
jgi:hypothetical protein